MTNRIIKDYWKNKPIIDAANDTINVMCVILLTAHKLFPTVMTKKAVCTFIDDRVQYCEISNGYEKDGVFDYKMQKTCDDIGVSMLDCSKIVAKFMHPVNRSVKDVSINNVALMFVQLNNEYGLGRERRSRLVAALLSDRAETDRPLERIQKMGGDIDITSISSVDYRKYRSKPDKTTYAEELQARRGLQCLKAYQDSIINKANKNETE